MIDLKDSFSRKLFKIKSIPSTTTTTLQPQRIRTKSEKFQLLEFLLLFFAECSKWISIVNQSATSIAIVQEFRLCSSTTKYENRRGDYRKALEPSDEFNKISTRWSPLVKFSLSFIQQKCEKMNRRRIIQYCLWGNASGILQGHCVDHPKNSFENWQWNPVNINNRRLCGMLLELKIAISQCLLDFKLLSNSIQSLSKWLHREDHPIRVNWREYYVLLDASWAIIQPSDTCPRWDKSRAN